MPDEESMGRQPAREIYREWQEDYALRRAGNAEVTQPTNEVAAPVAGPPHPWPSEIARENQRKPAGQDQAKSQSNDMVNGRDDGHSM